MKIKIGFVVLNYRTSVNTCILFETLNSYSIVDKIIVIDNCSKDNSVEKIKEKITKLNSKKIIFHALEENIGYARGNNIGLKELVEKENCNICFIINPDQRIYEDDLKEIIKAFENNPQFSLLGCVQKDLNCNKSICQFWELPKYKNLLFECFLSLRKINNRQKHFTIDSDQEIVLVEVVPGSFFGIRAEVIEKIGFLDEETFLFFEENCLAKKIKKNGYCEGIVVNATCHRIFNEASTIELRESGVGMKYYVEGLRWYAKKYICKNKVSYWVIHCMTLYMLLRGEIKKKFKLLKCKS